MDVGYFRNMTTIQLELYLRNSDLRRPLCPYLFKNAQLRELHLKESEDNILVHNYITYYEIKNPNNLTINMNASIDILLIKGNYCKKLDQRFFDLNKHIWPMASLYLQCGFNFIDAGFFRNFETIGSIVLDVLNSRVFYHSSDNLWLSAIFPPCQSFNSRTEMTAYLKENRYMFYQLTMNNYPGFDFPDEDFCLFKYFPRQKPVLSTISNATGYGDDDQHVFSCSFRYLTQNNLLISMASNVTANHTFSESILESCEFDKRLSLCSNFSLFFNNIDENYMDALYKSLYILNFIEFVGPVITFPIFAAIALILNLLVILIIRSDKNSKEKLFDSKMFKLIEMNSLFICIECFIYQFRLFGLCLGPSSIYCPPVSLHYSSFLKSSLAMMAYFGEAMKSSSMIAGLLFSIQRYIEATKSENKLLKRISGLRMVYLFLFALSYGFGVSSAIFFNMFLLYNDCLSFNIPGSAFLNPDSEYFETYHNQAQTAFYFAYYCLNDFIVIIINLAVDISLVHFIKSNLEEKLKNKSNKTELSKLEQLKLKEEEKKKATTEHKANVMIVLNVLIYVLCRFPELLDVVFVYLINGHLIFQDFFDCRDDESCYLFPNIIEYLYMLSYIFPIILYYKFNSNFNKGFRNFFGIKTDLLRPVTR